MSKKCVTCEDVKDQLEAWGEGQGNRLNRKKIKYMCIDE